MRVRAIHLEIANSLESFEFISCFERFCSRRGTPVNLFSDNAKTFKGACSSITTLYGVKWSFITERAPHKGGIWERLVRNVKVPMRIVLRQYTLKFSELATLICKIEAVINKRPICYVSDEVTERPLRPEDFLIVTINLTSNENCSLKTLLNKRNKLLQQFFFRWKKEYLLQGFNSGVSNTVPKLKEDSIVLVDDESRRDYWPLARVVKLLPGRDGVTRSVWLRLRGKLVKRGIHRLYPLEPVWECKV